jgi:hypothetical protein
MNEQHPSMIPQIAGQVRSMFYLVDEPTTAVSIEADGQTVTAQAFGQLALDLRALSRDATICATLHDAPPDQAHLIAFTILPAWGQEQPQP